MVTVQEMDGSSSSSNRMSMNSSSLLFLSGQLPWIRVPKSRMSSVGSGSMTRKPLRSPVPGKTSVWVVGAAKDVPRLDLDMGVASGGAVMGSAAAAWWIVEGVRMVIEGRFACVADGDAVVAMGVEGQVVSVPDMPLLRSCRCRCR